MDSGRLSSLLAPYLAGAVLSETQQAQFAAYLDLLLRWNARMNLTAIRDPEQIVIRHFGESLFAARHLYPSRCLATGDWRLLDIGSGAGFPGLPIKLWAPALQLTLLESNQRKATFLREVARTLQLTGVEVLTMRAETYAEPITNHQSQITDLTVTLRAVERFDRILPTAVRLLEAVAAPQLRLALLIGSSQVPAARSLAPRLAWSDPLPIPESSQRVLLIAHARG